jgi:Fe2+ transport system protein FeoA
MNEVSLNKLSPGERGTITRITTSALHVRQRLLEMGMTKGTAIEIVRYAPMGDPIEVKVKGYRLSLRREEAESIIIQRDRR